jgi:hypothetical protein
MFPGSSTLTNEILPPGPPIIELAAPLIRHNDTQAGQPGSQEAIEQTIQKVQLNSEVGISNRMVSNAIWIKHARVSFSKTIKLLSGSAQSELRIFFMETTCFPGSKNVFQSRNSETYLIILFNYLNSKSWLNFETCCRTLLLITMFTESGQTRNHCVLATFDERRKQVNKGRRSRHRYKLRPKHAHTNYFKFSFFNRYISDWNYLPSDVVELALSSFKQKLMSFLRFLYIMDLTWSLSLLVGMDVIM